jgi:hypothetical protein
MQTPFQLYDKFKLSIIQDSIDNVANNMNSLLSDMALSKKELTKVNFKKVCQAKNILYKSNKIKFILFEPSTNPGVTVFFPNFSDGWYTAVYNYTRLYNKSAFQVGFTIDNAMEYPAYFFNFFFTDKGQIKERTVHAIKEDKWVFFAKDNPLAIEDVDNYSKKKIKNRINNEIIIGYLKKAGYDLTDNNFFKSNRNAVLFSN